MEISVSPRQAFEDNIRPAELLLSVYRLLESKGIETQGQLMDDLRILIGAEINEELLLITNGIFLGLVRERARIPAGDLKRLALTNLLRQSVVAACTALEAFLPSVLKDNLPAVIAARGRDFFPQDEELLENLRELVFTLSDALRLIDEPNTPLFIANKIVRHFDYKQMTGKKGIHVVGTLLWVRQPWDQIARHLGREKEELVSGVEATIRRRNDIVHRADRSRKDPSGEAQDISLVWTMQAVDVMKHVCMAMDELIAENMATLAHNRRAGALT